MYRANWLRSQRINFMWDIIKSVPEPKRILVTSEEDIDVIDVLSTRLQNVEYEMLITHPEQQKNKAKSNFTHVPISTTKRYDIIVILGGFNTDNDMENKIKTVSKLLAKNGILYFEAPNHLAYSIGASGYRTIAGNGTQKGWHLTRVEWSDILQKTGLTTIRQYSGHASVWQFVWTLEKEKETKKDAKMEKSKSEK